MLITQRHKYALRAVFELAKQGRATTVKLADIAEAQAIPQRFLEVIRVQLRKRGLTKALSSTISGHVGHARSTVRAPTRPL